MMETRVVKITGKRPLGRFKDDTGPSRLEHWEVDSSNEEASQLLREAASQLRTKDTPVAFPTETVYGLGADATRSDSVKGIYTAKNRPSDNPLIIHVCDLEMLRGLLGDAPDGSPNPIPTRYGPLIDRFWPGPLTLLMPNPKPSRLAPEVTAGLTSFGARMPSTPLALSLIKLAGVPLAAPSANASTKPSPTQAHHVKHDLDGKIELILDGGSCHVGVESTVVDGLCDPPALLRPGGVGIDEIRSCPGWENVVKAYKDRSEDGDKTAPRAPGMKYKHYSPRARVVLYESSFKKGADGITEPDATLACTMGNGTSKETNGANAKALRSIGIIRTQRWGRAGGLKTADMSLATREHNAQDGDDQQPGTAYDVLQGSLVGGQGEVIGEVLDVDLGRDTRGIAQGLFSALRELDQRGADIIFVDGIEDEIDIAGAVMNRLRKAASEIRT